MPKTVKIDDSNRLFQQFQAAVETGPDRRGWIDDDGSERCWRQIQHDVFALVDELASAGIRPGDRVVTQIGNSYRAVLLAISIPAMGAIESPIDARVSQADLHRMAKRIGASAVVDNNIRRLGFDADHRVDFPGLGTAGLILWTSGTSQTPKPVVLGWDGILHNARGKLNAAPQTADDVRLTLLPLSHAYARTCDFVTWLISGGTLAVGEGFRGLREMGPVVRPTLVNAVPYLIEKVLNQAGQATNRKLPFGLERLRLLGCGGAALTAKQFSAISELGVTPIHGYGLTETSPVVCSASPADARPGTVGRPIHDTQVRISVTGEIECRGPGLMLGYWGDRKATEQRYTDDGWLRTGDRGDIDFDGMLIIFGRMDDVIILSTGYKFWPQALEQRLSSVPGINHVILRGHGTALEALLDASPGTDPRKLLELFHRIQEKDFPNSPQIARVTFLAKPLSYADGNLTVKGTVKRWTVSDLLDNAHEFEETS